MEKGERETHDFMNVESFSQLPFIRPAPPVKEKGGPGGGIRLFGIEFGCKDSPLVAKEESESGGETCEIETGGKEMDPNNSSSSNTNNNGDNNRRFECHYCCRNFPTSQALGGHQNAHKRERQHAKRAHLQSAAAMVHNGLSPEAHIYGLVNYRIGSSVSASANPINPSSFSPSNNTTTTYPTWNSHISPTNGRFYGTHHHQQPINGSPLGLWRIPPATAPSTGFHRERAGLMHPLPLLSGEELVKSSQVSGGSSVGPGSSQNPFGYESSSKADHVSLDLHL